MEDHIEIIFDNFKEEEFMEKKLFFDNEIKNIKRKIHGQIVWLGTSFDV